MALNKDLPADEKLPRPKNLSEKLNHYRKVYRWNEWNWSDHEYHCNQMNMPVKKPDQYTESELDIFLRDFEQAGMILYK